MCPVSIQMKPWFAFCKIPLTAFANTKIWSALDCTWLFAEAKPAQDPKYFTPLMFAQHRAEITHTYLKLVGNLWRRKSSVFISKSNYFERTVGQRQLNVRNGGFVCLWNHILSRGRSLHWSRIMWSEKPVFTHSHMSWGSPLIFPGSPNEAHFVTQTVPRESLK